MTEPKTVPTTGLTAALRDGRRLPAPDTRTFVARAAREGLVDVAYATSDSPFGPLLVAVTPAGIVRLAYPDEHPDDVLADLAARVSPRLLEVPARVDTVRAELDRYFAGRVRGFRTQVDWSLTSGFGRRVLRATAAIPFGEVSTYRDIAARAGSPNGSRAAGNALGANPIPIVVPCHRVLRTGGGLGGYTGGIGRKQLLLQIEGVLP
jgi:methylated-DNA-[protein]-cysteine S-methyltransferase